MSKRYWVCKGGNLFLVCLSHEDAKKVIAKQQDPGEYIIEEKESPFETFDQEHEAQEIYSNLISKYSTKGELNAEREEALEDFSHDAFIAHTEKLHRRFFERIDEFKDFLERRNKPKWSENMDERWDWIWQFIKSIKGWK